MERINSCEFVVTVMPHGSLGAEHKSLVDETLNNAFKKANECILAVPYLPVPKRKEQRVKFWIEQRSDPDYGRTFERYVDLKNYVFSLFECTRQELGKIHITFAEVDRNGQLSSSRSLSYIKPNFVSILQDTGYGMYGIAYTLSRIFEA